MKISNIETRYNDNCNFIYFSYPTVYNVIVFRVIYDVI